MQMTELAGHLPSIVGAAAAGAASKVASANHLYLVSCPWGIENTFTQMKSGNWATFLRSGINFDGWAPIAPYSSTAVSVATSTQAAVMGAFAVMSVATGQYYLDQINSELSGIKLGMDKILEFLYGDKKAELMSEISFAKYAYENFAEIMAHNEQRYATIVSLQEAKKVAMKDAEFYISDLSSALADSSGIESVVEKALLISESLDLSLQLAVMSSVLEAYYSQNHNKGYLEYVERELSLYIEKCDKFKLSAFSKLSERVESYKNLPTKKIPKEELLAKINAVLEPLRNGTSSPLKKTLHDGLYSSEKRTAYYLNGNGDIYVKDT